MSGCRDSNPESPVPKTGMLAVTPHPVVDLRNVVDNSINRREGNGTMVIDFLDQNYFNERKQKL